MAGTPLIEARGLVKHYGSTRAVKGISFRVSRGEVVGFLGPNGAGKSTTMKMLTGFLKPTAGQALVAGHDVAEDALSARRVLGYLPESAPLYDDMMVIDFLGFVAELRGVAPDLRRRRIKEACDRCGVTGVLGKDIGQLSKGYRQRVGLAQALLHDPDLLILDEPTSGLDPNQIIEIRSLIRDLGRDKTVLLSTHILPEVQATCGRIIIINEGQLVADDSPQALAEGSTGAVIRLMVKQKAGRDLDRAKLQALFSHLPGVRAVDAHDGEGAETLGFSLRAAGSTDPREAIFETVVSHDLILLDLHRERVSLEDTFRRLTRADVRGDAALGDNHVS
ncbi:MAG TPA: ATP-binding cassette domain-containing protein [Myxococcota bacterium]|nr:ATP-binding cassette domain-containing protein [Myxococcota bacterium]